MNRFILLLGFIVSITILGGCATTSKYIDSGNSVEFKTEIVKHPKAGAISQANIGESIIATSKKIIVPTLILEKSITHEGLFNGFTNIFFVKKGELELTEENSEGRFFSSKKGIGIQSPGGSVYLDGGIFVYDDETIPSEIYFKNKYNGAVSTEKPSEIHYKIIDKDEWSSESFIRELVYTGISGNTISVLYREYIKDMIRPAFTQEIKYDLKNSKIIGFKNARFEIIKADNASITYKTLSHLE